MRPPTRPRPLAPPAALAGAFLASWLCGTAPAATLVISVQTPDGRVLPGAVVTARPVDAPAKHVAPLRAVMDQVNRAFEPDLLVIPTGSTVEFPNSDAVSHQIYSFSPAKRFQLPLYRGKPYPPVHFEQSGVVTLGCNIHDEMVAYLVVTDAPYFGRTDAKGAWSAELPRGRYQVSIWHPRARDNPSDLDRELTIGEGDRAELTVRLQKLLVPAPIADRPHSWDY
ncbi:MAG TPA: methylamine utilization protein [Candidatus Dormibacteraeota bacterium]|nr:methylamine utilization protein [Candidatus Dormibacteraeota bacterium]